MWAESAASKPRLCRFFPISDLRRTWDTKLCHLYSFPHISQPFSPCMTPIFCCEVSVISQPFSQCMAHTLLLGIKSWSTIMSVHDPYVVSDRTRHFTKQGVVYKVMKVVHGNLTDDHCNWSDTQLSVLLLELY